MCIRDRFHLETNEQTGAKLLVKLEFLNPGGSIKDRACLLYTSRCV